MIFVPLLNCTVPGTGVVSCRSRTADVVNVVGSIGSLNTITMIALSGTSWPPEGGLVRTTFRGRTAVTASRTVTAALDALLVITTASVSPTLAAIGTGSNPPLTTTVVTARPVASSVIVALAPAGTEPGDNET